jgi:hypothetical protein
MQYTTFVHTLTNTEEIFVSVAGPEAIQVLLDFSEMTSGDTVVLKWTPQYTVANVQTGSVRELEHGVTTSDISDGVLGVDFTTWLSPVFPVGFAARLTIESTAGALFDVEVELMELGVTPP